MSSKPGNKPGHKQESAQCVEPYTGRFPVRFNSRQLHHPSQAALVKDTNGVASGDWLCRRISLEVDARVYPGSPSDPSSFFMKTSRDSGCSQRARNPGPLRNLGTAVITLLLCSVAAAACPKILLVPGVDVDRGNLDRDAAYWHDVGIDGFLLRNVMESWMSRIDPDKARKVEEFQRTFGQAGISSNFIKVSIFRQGLFRWREQGDYQAVVQNFRDAAALAKRAGLKGIALDFEPYGTDHDPEHGFWRPEAEVPDKRERVYKMGVAIGAAMREAYPEIELMVVPDASNFVDSDKNPERRARYQLSGVFWDGLVQAHFKHVIVGTESTYRAVDVMQRVKNVRSYYAGNLQRNGVEPGTFSVAPGLYPLGTPANAPQGKGKFAREDAARWRNRLSEALATREEYVWIFELNGAWQEDSPWGKGVLDPQFPAFVQALHAAKATCSPQQRR